MNGGWLRAAGAERQCAPVALTRRFWAALNFTVKQQRQGRIGVSGFVLPAGSNGAILRT